MTSTEDLLRCSICLDTYSKPRALPCLHTFCEHCLQEYINTAADSAPIRFGFECPLCRKHTVPSSEPGHHGNWASEFPVNHIIVSLLDSRDSWQKWLKDTGNQRPEVLDNDSRNNSRSFSHVFLKDNPEASPITKMSACFHGDDSRPYTASAAYQPNIPGTSKRRTSDSNYQDANKFSLSNWVFGSSMTSSHPVVDVSTTTQHSVPTPSTSQCDVSSPQTYHDSIRCRSNSPPIGQSLRRRSVLSRRWGCSGSDVSDENGRVLGRWRHSRESRVENRHRWRPWRHSHVGRHRYGRAWSRYVRRHFPA